MKKWFNKQTLVVFIITAFLFSGISVVAAPAIKEAFFNDEISINLDGKELAVSKITVIEAGQVNGSTYVKLRDIAEPMGGVVGYDSATKTIDINTNEGVNTMSTTTEKITQTPDGITQIDTWEDKQYIGALYIRNKIKEKSYDFTLNTKTESWQVVKGSEVILDNVPVTMLTGFGYGGVEVNYYINTILPLIQ
jgi:hypothetical protein